MEEIAAGSSADRNEAIRFFVGHPPLQTYFPLVLKDDTHRTRWSRLRLHCMSCGRDFKDDAVRGFAEMEGASACRLIGIAVCDDCKILSPIDMRLTCDGGAASTTGAIGNLDIRSVAISDRGEPARKSPEHLASLIFGCTFDGSIHSLRDLFILMKAISRRVPRLEPVSAAAASAISLLWRLQLNIWSLIRRPVDES